MKGAGGTASIRTQERGSRNSGIRGLCEWVYGTKLEIGRRSVGMDRGMGQQWAI